MANILRVAVNSSQWCLLPPRHAYIHSCRVRMKVEWGRGQVAGAFIVTNSSETSHTYRNAMHKECAVEQEAKTMQILREK